MHHAPACRSCGNAALVTILSLEPAGATSVPVPTPRFPSEEQAEPLDLAFCSSCALVQSQSTPSASAVAMRQAELARHADATTWPQRQLAAQVIAAQKLRPTSLVIEIGSQDGRFLKDYQAAGIPVLGIEPAVRPAELARLENGIPTLCRHFDSQLAAQLEGCGQPADVVHLRRMLGSLADPNALVAGLPIVLKETGVAVIEEPHVQNLFERGGLAIDRRLQSCFSLTSLSRLLSRHQLVVHDAERDAALGTFRVYVGRQGETADRVTRLLAEEAAWGIDRPDAYVRAIETARCVPAKVA